MLKCFDCQAGASSMWASCCGLLNEVMGTGAVRGQQPGFGSGAGPFRFAPSAGYSTYPPTSSGSPGHVCKACGQAFSVFRRKVAICKFAAICFCCLHAGGLTFVFICFLKAKHKLLDINCHVQQAKCSFNCDKT